MLFKAFVKAYRLFILLYFIPLFCALSSPRIEASTSEKNELTLDTKIVSASVYSRSAQIKRIGELDVPAGSFRIVCGDLPKKFIESSLLVEGRGTTQARIIGIDLRRRHKDEHMPPRHGELKEKLEELKNKYSMLQIERQSLNNRKKLMSSISRFSLDKAQDQLARETFRVEDWRNLLDFFEAEEVQVEKKIDALSRALRELSGEIEWVKSELNAMHIDERSTREVVIDCEVTTPGRLTIDLSYLVPDTAWNPEYMIRYIKNENKVELSYNAKIWQATGEDWKNVSVMLSTAKPHIGASPPKLRPRYLSISRDERRQRESKKTIVETKLEEMPADDVEDAIALKSHIAGGKGDAAGMPPAPPVPHMQAAVSSTEFAANLQIRRRIDLETGAEPKRSLIVREKLPGEFSLFSVPRLSRHVYVEGKFKNTLGVPLLAGLSEVYIDAIPEGSTNRVSNFVGRETIEQVADGQEFVMHLGIDQDIKIDHKLERKERLTRPGKKTKKIRYHYLITIENHKTGEAVIALKDRIPVSTVKEIKIDDVELTPPPDEKGDDGIITWRIPIAAGEKKEVRISYTIVLPGDMQEALLHTMR